MESLTGTRAELNYLAWLVAGLAAAIALGALATADPAAAAIALVLGVGLIALKLSPSTWIFAALAVAFLGRVVAEFGAGGGAAPYLEIPLVWVGFTLALVTTRPTGLARRLVGGLAALFACVVVSTLVSGAEPQRAVFYFCLLAEPFAAVATLLLCPPTKQTRDAILVSLIALLAIQIPVSLAQFALHGQGDSVQGTFVGSLAGAHLLGAAAALGAFWIFSRGGSPWRYSIVVGLACLPLISGSKQIILALPILLLVQTSRSWVQWGIRAAAIAVLIGVLVLTPTLNQTYGVTRIGETLNGQTSKEKYAEQVVEKSFDDPVSVGFGQGPAMTVSRAAYLSVDPLVKTDSPIELLHIHPAALTIQLGALDPSIVSSFDSAVSSAVGVFGDLGLAGTLVYAWIFIGLYAAARRSGSREAGGAMAGLALMAVLGFVADWWEEGPFTVLVAILVGLALTDPDAPGRAASDDGLNVRDEATAK
jgi:hypothetical protein